MPCIRSACVLVLQFIFLSFSPAFAQTWINSVDVSTTTNKATIRWTTAVPANSQIKYGINGNYGKRNGLDAAMVTAHAMTLSSLAVGTTYHFRIMSSDASNALVTSMDYAFTTQSGVVGVSVTPFNATIASGGTQQFSVTVTNCEDKSVTWSATAGTVSSSGLFTAPTVTTDQTVTVTATSVTDPTKMMEWYQQYFDVLSNIGWVIQQKDFAEYHEKSDEFDAHLIVLDAKGSLVGESDSGGDGTNAGFTDLLPAGTYYVVAKPQSEYRSAGAYRLSLGVGE